MFIARGNVCICRGFMTLKVQGKLIRCKFCWQPVIIEVA